MRAMQLFHPKSVEQSPLSLVEIPKPEPGTNQVRISVDFCGVCHTDLHIVEGDIHPPNLPIVPGHQVVGRIDALGEGVTSLEIGQRVGIPWFHAACGGCRYCRKGWKTFALKRVSLVFM